MYRPIPNSILVVFLVIFSSVAWAQSGASYDPTTYEGAVISIGKGGGFAGTVREYRLLDTGRLYLKELGNTHFRLIRKKCKKKAYTWFYELERTGVRCIDYQNPGNVYQFVGLKDAALDKRVTWGNNDSEVAPEITDYYSRFMAYWVNKKTKK